MESSDQQGRRELQGPRPAPLKVRKDPHKFKKPPVAPPPQAHQNLHPPPPRQQQQQQHRAPVIIYAVSPKIVHTNPSDFMSLVQRLTGPEALSPAARAASCDRTEADRRGANLDVEDRMQGSSIRGILSPAPSSLPPILPEFFSPSFDPSFLSGLLQDLSPAVTGGDRRRSPAPVADGRYLFSPGGFLSTPLFTSPGAVWDLFNQLD